MLLRRHIGLGLLTIQLAGAYVVSLASEKPCPIINTTIDDEVDITKPIAVSLWIDAPPGTLSIPKKLQLDFVNGKHLTVNPAEITLQANGTRVPVKLDVNGPNQGIVFLQGKASAWPEGCTALQLPVDTGLKDVARLNSDLITTDPSSGAREHLVGGDEKTFTILFKTLAGNDLDLGAPVTLALEATSDATLSTDRHKWDRRAIVSAHNNNPRSETVFLKLPNHSVKDAVIYVQVRRASGDRVLLSGQINFDCDYPWWARLLAILAGCSLYALIEALSSKGLGKFTWKGFGIKLTLTLLLGLLAFVVEDTKILGFDVDKTTIKGNVLFGVLVGCLSLEGLINRIRDFVKAAPKESGESKDKKDVDPKPATGSGTPGTTSEKSPQGTEATPVEPPK